MNAFRLVATLVVAGWVNAAGAGAPAADATVFDVGSLRVERHGERGAPVILIPGLASGAWVWQDSIAALRAGHRVHAVTLAGFDGRPAVPGDVLALAAASLRELIDSLQPEKPVLVGHSLGGTLALMFAAAHSELIAGVIAVDGLPVFPGTEAMDAGQRQALGERVRAQFVGMSPAAFEAQQLQYMSRVGVADATKAVAIAGLTSRSDAQAVGDYAGAVMKLDLRAQLPSILVPVLAVAPYLASDHAGTSLTEEAKRAYYRSLLAGVVQLDVVTIAPARHFVMIDQPRAFNEILSRFLAAPAVR